MRSKSNLLARAEAEREERRRLRAQAQYERMQSGPYLEPDGVGGQWVVVPSDWYNEEARAFWVSVGCRFLRRKAWVRSPIVPYQGQTYTANQWLRSLRKKFFELHAAELVEAGEVFGSGGVYEPR
jgi:hypothetical protein